MASRSAAPRVVGRDRRGLRQLVEVVDRVEPPGRCGRRRAHVLLTRPSRKWTARRRGARLRRDDREDLADALVEPVLALPGDPTPRQIRTPRRDWQRPSFSPYRFGRVLPCDRDQARFGLVIAGESGAGTGTAGASAAWSRRPAAACSATGRSRRLAHWSSRCKPQAARGRERHAAELPPGPAGRVPGRSDRGRARRRAATWSVVASTRAASLPRAPMRTPSSGTRYAVVPLALVSR